MLYSILIYVPEDLVDAMSTEEIDAHIARHLEVHDQLRAQDRLGPVVRLMPTTTAVQLRTSTTPHIVDGPFAETKEQLLGFYIVDCESLEAAIDVARSLPSVRTIFEIRPVKLFFPGVGLEQVGGSQAEA
ncbi:MAG TPA: YciI family protein [Steroidobacteraceae bacterium]|nr:YciI family protein [Steroidobacteraceae bacterium]